MNDKSGIVPIISPDSVQLHFDDERKVVIGSWVEGFLNLSSLHEIVSRKILIIGLGRCSKGLSEDILSMKIVIKQVKVPSAIILEHAIWTSNILRKVRMSILEVLLNIIQTFKISPNPIIIADVPFMTNCRIRLHTFVSTNTYVFINQYHTIYLCVFWYTSVVN